MTSKTCRRTALLLGAFLAVSVSVPALGAEAELEALFPRQVDLFVDSSGVARLPLTPEILAECRSDLSDLRVFDAEGREVPYLVDTGAVLDRKLEVTQRLEPEVLGIERQEVHREDGPPLQRETFRLALPSVPPSTGHWDIVFHTRAGEWVRTVEVSATSPSLIAQGSLWRLTGPQRERVRLTLPPLDSSVRELTVRLQGEDSTPLDPTFVLESSRSLDPRRRIEVPLEEVGRRREEGRTLIDLERPRGITADRLHLSTSTSSYHRRVEVWDEGPGRNEEALGAADLFRWNSQAEIGDDELALRRAGGDRLRVVIDDGDSPPLEDLTFAAVLTGPVLLVDLKASTAATTATGASAAEEPTPPKRAGVLRFGGGRAFRPNYDLSALAPSRLPARGDTAVIGLDLADAQRLPTVRLGTIGPNPHFDPTPALGFALRVGAPLDRGRYSHRRTISVESSPEGLNRLPLQLDDLAVARRDLADLRVVDDLGNQRPYLLEPLATRSSLDLAITTIQAKDSQSRYEIALPARPATLDRLVFESEVPFFDRPYRLFASGDAGETLLAEGRLVRRIGDPRPLSLAFAAKRVDGIVLQIDDGDDAPLTWSSVRGRFPVPQLFFAAPPGSYEFLLGDSEAETPRYELETVRDVALSIESALPTVGPLEPNPDRGFRWGTEGRMSKILLWAAMGLAVLVLIVLTLRLARTPEAS